MIIDVRMMNALHVLGVWLDFMVGGSINRLLVKLVILEILVILGIFYKFMGGGKILRLGVQKLTLGV